MSVGYFTMGFAIVRTDSEDDDLPVLKLGVEVAKTAGFFRATGGIVARIEVENHAPSAKIGEANKITFAVA
jgi:hypothetical protein